MEAQWRVGRTAEDCDMYRMMFDQGSDIQKWIRDTDESMGTSHDQYLLISTKPLLFNPTGVSEF